MSGGTLASLLGLAAVADFLVLLAAFTLRDFSRTRLDDICLEKGRRDRFGDILKWDEDALLLCEMAASLLTAILAGLAVYAFVLLLPPGPGWWEWTRWTALLLGAALLYLFLTAVLPWTVSRVGGERFLFHVWPLLRWWLRVARPALAACKRLDELLHRVTGQQRTENGGFTSITEEIRAVVDEGQREGLLEHEARTMIHRVMELRDVDAAAIMTPRTEMVCVRSDATLNEARALLLEAGHSRIPVIGETTDDIKGILYAKDLLAHVNGGNGNETPLTEIAREAFYVPETTAIDKLLETMKRKRVHLAIVVDEYGGVAGLVSLEDILEEIVGEIVDEYDPAEESGIVTLGPDTLEVHSRVHIDDLNDQFRFDLPEDADYDTVGGFVFRQLGHVPAVGETFHWGGLRFTVKEADKRSIHKIRVHRDRTPAATASDER